MEYLFLLFLLILVFALYQFFASSTKRKMPQFAQELSYTWQQEGREIPPLNGKLENYHMFPLPSMILGFLEKREADIESFYFISHGRRSMYKNIVIRSSSNLDWEVNMGSKIAYLHNYTELGKQAFDQKYGIWGRDADKLIQLLQEKKPLYDFFLREIPSKNSKKAPARLKEFGIKDGYIYIHVLFIETFISSPAPELQYLQQCMREEIMPHFKT